MKDLPTLKPKVIKYIKANHLSLKNSNHLTTICKEFNLNRWMLKKMFSFKFVHNYSKSRRLKDKHSKRYYYF